MSYRRLARFLVAFITALLALAGCAGAPAQPAQAPTASQPTLPIPTSAPPTAALTPTPLPSPSAAPSPTAGPPTAPPPATATPAATATPQPIAGYFVYARPDGSLWRADGPGKPPLRLAGASEPGATPPWAASPDGRTIAFVLGAGVWNSPSDRPPEAALWLVGADGSNPRKIQELLPPRGVDPTPGGDDAFNLLPALASLQRLAWSPDGGMVAFVSAHENQVDLYAAALDGTITRLTDTPALEQGPRWSPDGTKIACRTTAGFGTGAGWSDVGLAVAARRGGDPLLLMDDQALAGGRGVAAVPSLLWIGPDTLVAGLWSGPTGQDEVRSITVSSGAAETIFGEPYSALDWSDTPRQLAIAGASESAIESQKDRALAPGLYVWMPGAGEPIRVIAGPVEALTWSAQGDALAYSMAKSGKQPGVGIWSLLMDGDLKHLADEPAQYLRWSPDGQRLAAGAAVYGRDGRRLADLAGRNVLPAGWGSQGLFYFTLADDGQTFDLWLWDGAASQRVDTGLGRPEGAAVVPKT
jgi:dipeptidyl aminopeptidase/acylaminoacyl peptidase